MAVIRVNKTADYTVMSNAHFKVKEMSLKAKGLLSLMLSLPDNWDYSIAGLVTLSKDGKDSVMNALTELENFGFLKRTRLLDDKGRFAGYDYDIYENPKTDNPNTDKPKEENPCAGNPNTDKPKEENPRQLNTNTLNTNLSNNEKSNTNQSITNENGKVERLISAELIDEIKEQIDYDIIKTHRDIFEDDLDGIIDAIAALKTVTEPRKFGENYYSPEYIRLRANEINSYHVEYVFECFYEKREKIGNIKGYLMTALFNAPATCGVYYSNRVRAAGAI